jgi:hypothetical protein
MECVMKKYRALVLVAALAGASAVAVRAAPGDARIPSGVPVNEVQIGTLDKRLSERVAEQQELLGMVQRMLTISFQEKLGVERGLLSGTARPAAPPVAVAVVHAAAAPLVAPPPWWLDYKAQMIYVSGNDRYAVVNGRMVLPGQALDPQVVVERIGADRVVLRRGAEQHTYLLAK